MTQETSITDKEAVRAWYKKELETVVREMLKIEAINGVAVEANPVWSVPFKILIAKVWNANEKSRFIWTISGDRVVTDHIAGSIASKPQEVARHFALKWQMDAKQLDDIAKGKTPVENTQAHMEGYTEKLVEYAELLYDLSGRDEIWVTKFH